MCSSPCALMMKRTGEQKIGMTTLRAPKSLWASPPRVALALLLLWLAFALAVVGAARTSITIDESFHIGVGYSVLDTGEWRMLEQHPPLIYELATWPLLLIPDLTPARDMPGWAESDVLRLARFVVRYRPIDRVVFPVRVPVALLSALLGAFVYRWAADWRGRGAGLLALGLYALDPNILANAQVLTTDLGAVCFIFIAVYFFQRFLRRLTWQRMVVAGIALGLAQSSKASAALLLPIVFLLAVAHALTVRQPRSTRRAFFIRQMLALAALMLVAFLTLWATYGFALEQPPGWPWAVPLGGHIKTFLLVQQHIAEGHPEFLFGQVGTHGWWWYFPFAFAIKTPLPTLILLGVALVRQILYFKFQNQNWKEVRELIWRSVMLGTFPALFFLSTLFSTVNIGYRHILPIIPFLFVFIGNQISNLKPQISNRAPLSLRHLVTVSPRLPVAVILGWYVISTTSILPFPNGYFNELVGGPDHGWKYLADSNTEWGQSVKELKRYMDARGWSSVKLSLFTFTDPAAYGLSYEPLSPMKDTPPVLPARFNPPPGRYAISATSLDGIPLADPEQFDWFRHREPTDRVAHTMFVYDVPPPETPRAWAAQCATPVTPLGSEQITEGFGRDDLRQATFDCAQSWLYPPGAGWYVLSRDAALRPNRFIALRLARARLIYEQKQAGFVPPFAVYEWTADEAVDPDRIQAGIAAPSEWPPTRAETEGRTVSAPLSLEGGLVWLGYRLDRSQVQAGQVLELETFWQVEQLPVERLSLMAHLLAEDGRVVSVGDGLGVPVENWQVGDIIAQRHELKIPPDASPGAYWAHVGVYTLADLRRLAVKGQPAADRIVLARIKVTD
jgi:hypothetical protein